MLEFYMIFPNYLLIELLKYTGAARDVFNISLDLQVMLSIFREGEAEGEYEMVQ